MTPDKSLPLVAKQSIKIRQAVEADIPFLFNSWLKSFRASMPTVSNAVYFEFQHRAIEALLKRCNVLVACSTTDDNELYGYIVFEQIDNVFVLHYAYVKHSFRRLGLFGKLMHEQPKSGFYTHRTQAGDKLAAKLGYIYNPYLGMGVQ